MCPRTRLALLLFIENLVKIKKIFLTQKQTNRYKLSSISFHADQNITFKIWSSRFGLRLTRQIVGRLVVYTQESNIHTSCHIRYVTLQHETFCLHVETMHYGKIWFLHQVCEGFATRVYTRERRERIIIIPVATLSTARSCCFSLSLLIYTQTHTIGFCNFGWEEERRQLCGTICKFTQLVLSAFLREVHQYAPTFVMIRIGIYSRFD